MKMLLMFVVAAVLSGLSEGSNITRCELKSRLDAAALPLPHSSKGPTVEDLIAKIVCHVEKSTGFNTNAVSQLTLQAGGAPPVRGRRAAKSKGSPSKNESPERSGSDESLEEQHNGNSGSHSQQQQQQQQLHPQQAWTLYGLFQLSDQVICSDGVTTSHNICGKNCTEFIDDDITDDIACLNTTIATLQTDHGKQYAEDLSKMFNLLYQKECDSVVASKYFLGC